MDVDDDPEGEGGAMLLMLAGAGVWYRGWVGYGRRAAKARRGYFCRWWWCVGRRCDPTQAAATSGVPAPVYRDSERGTGVWLEGWSGGRWRGSTNTHTEPTTDRCQATAARSHQPTPLLPARHQPPTTIDRRLSTPPSLHFSTPTHLLTRMHRSLSDRSDRARAGRRPTAAASPDPTIQALQSEER